MTDVLRLDQLESVIAPSERRRMSEFKLFADVRNGALSPAAAKEMVIKKVPELTQRAAAGDITDLVTSLCNEDDPFRMWALEVLTFTENGRVKGGIHGSPYAAVQVQLLNVGDQSLMVKAGQTPNHKQVRRSKFPVENWRDDIKPIPAGGTIQVPLVQAIQLLMAHGRDVGKRSMNRPEIYQLVEVAWIDPSYSPNGGFKAVAPKTKGKASS